MRLLDSAQQHRLPGNQHGQKQPADLPAVRLSKSKLTTYRHCAKRLWLQVYRRDVGVIDPRTRQVFEAGHRIGELARLQVANGVLIDPDPRNLMAALAETRSALPLRRPLFEPAFLHQGVVVRVDILQPDRNGTWRLVEVKNASGARPYHIHDAAAQTWVLTGCEVNLSGASIRLPTQVMRPGARDWRRRTFVDIDVTDSVTSLDDETEAIAAAARMALEGPEPIRQTGMHCKRPFRCEFIEYCSKA